MFNFLLLFCSSFLLSFGQNACLSPFQFCSSGECALSPNTCGNGCESGDYVCPDQKTCVKGAENFVNCPNLKGTIWDYTMSVDDRVSALVGALSLDQKYPQLTNDAPEIYDFGVPAYNWLNDDEHGVRNSHATQFPDGCGLGGTWSKQDLHLAGSIIGNESRSLYNSHVSAGQRGHGVNGDTITLYAPNMNLVRDPRWGRSQEVYSEDPSLSGKLTYEIMTGFQFGGAQDNKYWLTGGCCKHYAAYDLGYEEAVSIALKAGCDQEGGGTTAIDQIPQAINDGMLTEDDVDTAFSRLFRVRVKLGLFDPPTMVAYNYMSNDTAEDPAHLDAARMIAAHSVGLYKNNGSVLPLDANKVNNLVVIGPQGFQQGLLLGNYATYPDRGVVSILEGLRNALGEPTETNCSYLSNTDYYQAGQTGYAVWDPSDCCKMCYEQDSCNYWTFYQGECYLKETDDGETQSSGRTSGKCFTKPNNGNSRVKWSFGCMSIECPNDSGFSDAVNLIKSTNGVSAVLAIVGLDQAQESEGHDRSVIELPGMQNDMVTAVYNTTSESNIPLICLMIHGGTLALGPMIEECDVILDGWYPGMMGGAGIADVIFGNVNAGGRASVTYYESTSDLPQPGEMDEYAGNGVTYRYFKGEPVFPFGHGLSYTTFKYSNLKVNTSNSISGCDVVKVTVTVSNTGNMDGDEVVQLYIQQPMATVPVPQVRLADFERVSIKSGDSMDVNLILTPRYHGAVYQDDNSIWYKPDIEIEKGDFTLFVGGGQPNYYDGGVLMNMTVSTAESFSDCPNQV